MEFDNWLNNLKLTEPTLEDFINKLTPFFTDTGFNSSEFERRINLGLDKCDEEVDESLKLNQDA